MKPKNITCVEPDDFSLLEVGKVYELERVTVYEGKLYAAVKEVPHYLFPQRRFLEDLEQYK